ncbi:MAG: heme A synthase [Geitlerinemataceae cyanobacterium]
MTNPVVPLFSSQTTAAERPPVARVRGLLWKLVFATLILMAIGSATRVANAGLACPDWPLCYGKVVPMAEMNLQVFLEWFHRMDASAIGLLTIALLGRSLQWRSRLPRWLAPVSALALLLVVVQGGLGAFTVTELLRFDIVTAHLGTALLFFVVLVAATVALVDLDGDAESSGTQSCASPATESSATVPRCQALGWVGAIAALLIYLQSLLGALVSSQWALHQCLGGFASLCRIMYGHLFGVVPPTLAVLVLVVGAWRSQQLPVVLRRLAYAAGGLVALQIALGFATFWLHLQVEPLTVAHQTIGATLLGSLVAFATIARRLARAPELLQLASEATETGTGDTDATDDTGSTSDRAIRAESF